MFEQFMDMYFAKLLLIIAITVAGMIGRACAKVYSRFIDSKEKEAVAAASMLYVENVYKLIHGPEKLQRALDTARIMLNKKGIPFDAMEMEVLIEAAHCEFNDTFNKVKAEAEHDKTLDTGDDTDMSEYGLE